MRGVLFGQALDRLSRFPVKRAKGLGWKHIAAEIGGVSPILIVGALLGIGAPRPADHG